MSRKEEVDRFARPDGPPQSLPTARLKPGDHCLITAVEKRCLDQLPSRRLAGTQQHHSRQETLPWLARAAPPITRPLRYAQGFQVRHGDHTSSAGREERLRLASPRLSGHLVIVTGKRAEHQGFA
jgi:hypothetical protein